MEGDVQSQSAPAPSDADVAGTATQATDAAAGTEVTSEQTPPVGTTDTSSATATAEETATSTDETAKSRRERQREARKQAAPPPEPVKTPEQIIAEHEATQRAQREATERQQRQQQRYAQWLGQDRTNPNDPNSPTRYQQAWNEAHAEIPPFPEGGTVADLEEHNKKLTARDRAFARLREFDERNGMLQEVYTPAQQAARFEARDWLGNEIERGIAGLGLDVQEIVASVKDPNQAIPQIVQTIGERVKAAVTAELQPKIDDLEDDLAAMTEDRDSWMRKAGGAAPQPLRGGVAGSIGKTTLNDLINQPDFAERAMRGEFAGLDLTK